MKDEKLLLTIAVIAVALSVIAAGITYFSIIDLTSKLTALVTQATANLTVETVAIVNFTTNNISWGSGRVTSGTAAYLTTLPIDNVTGGNWTLQVAGGLRLENAGNVNVTLNLTGTKTAASFIGGTSPSYQWNVSASEANSCLNRTGDGTLGLNLNLFHNVNTTVGESMKCFTFNFRSASDQIRIDFNLTIPEDSSTGALTDTITATAVTDNPVD